MKLLTKYNKQVIKVFSDFLEDKMEVKLYRTLHEIEDNIREEIVEDAGYSDPEEGLWVRFFKNDTAATTLRDIRNDLNNSNRSYLEASMEICVETNEIQLYFS